MTDEKKEPNQRTVRLRGKVEYAAFEELIIDQAVPPPTKKRR
jgi:hypothetical protein